MNAQVRAILWAQWRSLLNYYPKSNKTGVGFGASVAAIWYGLWGLAAVMAARVFAVAGADGVLLAALPGGLLFVFLYWQVVPILLVSTGVSLSMRMLRVYPVPNSQLFLIEMLLRLSTSFEMALLLGGLAAGLAANPRLPKWAALAILPFALFNLCLSAGARQLMTRLFERKHVREVAVLALVTVGALPQLLIATGGEEKVAALFRGPGLSIWPWSATAAVATGHITAAAVAALAVWTAAAYGFGRWQFARSLAFDADESNARPGKGSGLSPLDRLFAWPSLVFADPLGALVEKEIRFLSRAPRFRLVFTMGFTFGLVIWLPMAFGRHTTGGVFERNYLTFISVYALLLMGDVCFWNVFGFDRLAAQAYWAMPVPLATVLKSKNISALFFVLLETTAVISVCALLRMPVDASKLGEAYAVVLVVSSYLFSLGNLTSTSNPRAINPAKAMRSGSPGRLQALMLLLYPAAAAPVLLAYGARYAFESEAAFFVTLGISGLVGAVLYWVSMDSAVAAAETNKERLLTVLSQGEGLIQG